jgi:hypothetical protein
MELAQESEHCLRPAEAFALIGDETRIAILEALWHVGERPAEFTTLYEMTETDNSAQFNYHLNQLTGHFVRKRDDGYELRTAGERVIQAVVDGSFNAHPDLDPFETGDECTQCRGSLVATYDEEKLAISCPACGHTHGQYSFPPGGLISRELYVAVREAVTDPRVVSFRLIGCSPQLQSHGQRIAGVNVGPTAQTGGRAIGHVVSALQNRE